LVQKYIKTEAKSNLFNDPVKENGGEVPFWFVQYLVLTIRTYVKNKP
jgi:hypothetical protein